MLVRFWGTRGSIAVPGPDTVRYGGNTTCIEIETNAGARLILDGGTGIRPLGLRLAEQGPTLSHIFLTHTHWDHIQGLPFFAPLFAKGNRVRFHGSPEPVSGKSLRDTLAVQLEHCYFPVAECELSATVEHVDLKEGQVVTVGDATITPVMMNHPVTCLGYRVDADGVSVFFTGDHEPPYNIYAPGDPEHAAYQGVVEERRAHIDAALGGLDLFITDATYTENEYPRHRGWGHSSIAQCLAWAERVGAKTLCLTHHEPTRRDDELDELAQWLDEGKPDRGFDVIVAKEGMELVVSSAPGGNDELS